MLSPRSPIKMPKHSLGSQMYTNEKQPFSLLKGHLNSVDCVSINPLNPNDVISGSFDKTIRRWDVEKQKTLTTYDQHKQGVWTVNFSPNSDLLISGSSDKTAILWDMKSNKPIEQLKHQKGYIYWARFNQDGSQFATGGEDENVYVFDTKTRKQIINFPYKNLICYAGGFSLDGRFLVTADFAGVISLFDAKTFKLVCSTQPEKFYNFEGEYVENRALGVDLDFRQNSLSGLQIYAGFINNLTRVYEYDNQKNQLKLQKEFYGHCDSVKHICLNAQAGIFTSSSRDGSCRVWKVDNCGFSSSLMGHNDTCSCSSIYHDNQRTIIATSSWDQMVHVYKL